MFTIKTSNELDQILNNLSLSGISSDGLLHIETYIRTCWDQGVQVVVDESITDIYGSYNPHENLLTLGSPAFQSENELLDTMEHELIHVFQDAIAGIENSVMQPLNLPINAHGLMTVVESYGNLDPLGQVLELEANSAEVDIDHTISNEGFHDPFFI